MKRKNSEIMEGVQFIVDSQGKKTEVVIDLKKQRALWEDIYGNWLAEKRKHEPREALQFVRDRLKSQGKLRQSTIENQRSSERGRHGRNPKAR